MNNKSINAVVGVGVMAVALGAIAKPADAFVITNTSATWDNVTLTDGAVVGSAGEAASADNYVVFRDVDGESQVRWGEAGYGWTWEENWELTTKEVESGNWEWQSDWKKNRWGRWYDAGDWEWVTTTKTVEEWVDKGHWVAPTADYKSGLGFKGVDNLSLDVGEVFNIGSLTHYNQSIYSRTAFGESAEITLDLDFGDSGIGAQSFNFAFSVDETENDQAVCPYQTDAGKGCSDQITWDFSIDESNSFMFEGEEYTLELVGFSEQVAASTIVNEFTSQEKANNSAGLFARIVQVDTSEEIPEPASLLGLAGLGLFVARSRKKRISQLLA
ncbi:MAG: THxN family PEP-CTERM protein [Cyanobacteria bacterium J06614_10]